MVGGGPCGNRLLDALDPASRVDVLKSAHAVTLAHGDVVSEPGRPCDGVLFPIDCVLAIALVTQSGAVCEVGMIGNEGAAGVECAFGAATVRTTICQIEGRAIRLDTTAFLSAITHYRGFDVLVRATEKARIFYLEQMIACNSMHTVHQRFARWLLLIADRTRTATFHMTHEMISHVLGVRRASISNAAADLSREGAIEYDRHGTRIKDRALVASHSCECYRDVTTMFDEALDSWAAQFLHLQSSVRSTSSS